MRGWDFPNHLAGRAFSVVVHGDAAGTETLRRILVDWLKDMGLISAGHAAELDRYVGYYEPYALSHDALDRDHAFQEETRNAARALVKAVKLMRLGKLPSRTRASASRVRSEPSRGARCPCCSIAASFRCGWRCSRRCCSAPACWPMPFTLWLAIPFAVAAVLVAVGIHDLVQPSHSILRNYPILAHMRFIFEAIRPELRQYFFEGDKDGTPFSRDRRAIVYQRAKMAARRAAVRHPVRRLFDRLRVDAPFDRAAAGDQGAVPDHDRRRRLHQALLGLGVQHLGHELRRALGQRHPRAERRRQARRLRPRHRRRRLQPLSPRRRRRHHLGSGLGLFRLPQSRRHLQRRQVRRGRRQPAGQDGRAEAQPGRQARPWRRAARAQGERRDRPDARRADGRGLHLAVAATRPSRRRSR